MIGGSTIKDAMKRALQKLFTNNLACVLIFSLISSFVKYVFEHFERIKQ